MIVGVTGHQDLGDEEQQRWVSNSLEQILGSLCVEKGLSCLARGTDQVFAEILVRRKIPLWAVLPCKRIEDSFAMDVLPKFQALLGASSECVTLPFERPSEEAFAAAGKYLVDHSEVLLAVWDGKPAHGFGGTGDIVAYARAQSRQVIHLNTENRSIRGIPVQNR